MEEHDGAMRHLVAQFRLRLQHRSSRHGTRWRTAGQNSRITTHKATAAYAVSMTEKPGPKPGPSQDRQASQLQIRINVRDKAALAAAADRVGLSLSAWAKQVLLRAAKRQRKSRPV